MFHWFKKHTADGLERPDPTPLEVNLGRPLTLAEQILRFSSDPRNAKVLNEMGLESFDQADDIDPDDDGDDKRTPYEEDFNGREVPFGLHARMDEMARGMVEEMPEERQSKAKSWFRPKEKNSPADAGTDKKAQ